MFFSRFTREIFTWPLSEQEFSLDPIGKRWTSVCSMAFRWSSVLFVCKQWHRSAMTIIKCLKKCTNNGIVRTQCLFNRIQLIWWTWVDILLLLSPLLTLLLPKPKLWQQMRAKDQMEAFFVYIHSRSPIGYLWNIVQHGIPLNELPSGP